MWNEETPHPRQYIPHGRHRRRHRFGGGFMGGGGDTGGAGWTMGNPGNWATPGGSTGFGTPLGADITDQGHGTDIEPIVEHRLPMGRHAGKGPKGYRRGDERILEEVNDALTHDHDVDATEIEVKVAEGEVTLTGFVADRAQKRHAEDIADSCLGVRDVHNQLRIGHPSGGKGTVVV